MIISAWTAGVFDTEGVERWGRLFWGVGEGDLPLVCRELRGLRRPSLRKDLDGRWSSSCVVGDGVPADFPKPSQARKRRTGPSALGFAEGEGLLISGW